MTFGGKSSDVPCIMNAKDNIPATSGSVRSSSVSFSSIMLFSHVGVNVNTVIKATQCP